jgi:hypothetical protein
MEELPLAETVPADRRHGGLDVVKQFFVLGQSADHAQDCRGVAGRCGADFCGGLSRTFGLGHCFPCSTTE